MTRFVSCFILLAALGSADTQPPWRSIGLREAIRLAMEQSPEIQLARLEVEKSSADLAAIRAERSVQLYAGSGLGATSGIPQSIQGAAPSVAQLTLRQPLIDIGRPRRADSARETVRSGRHAAEAAAEESVYQAGVQYLDFESAMWEVERLGRELEHFERIERSVEDRVEEGVEIPLAFSRARLDTAKARDRLAGTEARFRLLEADLRRTLGVGRGVRLRPAREDSDTLSSVGDAVDRAVPRPLDEHPELASLQAGIRAARHSVREARSKRHPKLDIVGQYALLARFNNYDDYFRRFQRHNWQAGVALEIPLFSGRGVAEQVARARLEERELALRESFKREDLEKEGQRVDLALREAERLAELAKLELDYARESLDVLLAQFEEGTISLGELERARVVESTAWGGLVASRYALAKAQLGVVYSAGGIREAFAD